MEQYISDAIEKYKSRLYQVQAAENAYVVRISIGRISADGEEINWQKFDTLSEDKDAVLQALDETYRGMIEHLMCVAKWAEEPVVLQDNYGR